MLSRVLKQIIENNKERGRLFRCMPIQKSDGSQYIYKSFNIATMRRDSLSIMRLIEFKKQCIKQT